MRRRNLLVILLASMLCLGSGWFGIVTYVRTTVHNAVAHDDARLRQAQEAADRSRTQVAEQVRILACQLVLAEVNTADPTTQTGIDKRQNFLAIAHDPLLHCDGVATR